MRIEKVEKGKKGDRRERGRDRNFSKQSNQCKSMTINIYLKKYVFSEKHNFKICFSLAVIKYFIVLKTIYVS